MFWLQVKIPTKYHQDSIKKLEQLFYEWKYLKKNNGCQTETQKANEPIFSATIEELFDIAHAEAMQLI